MLKGRGVPVEFDDATLENFDWSALGMQEKQFDPNKSYYFVGAFGTGKTHLAVAIQRKHVEMTYGLKNIFVEQLQLNDIIRSNFSRDYEQTKAYRAFSDYLDCDHLILDDLGEKVSSPILVEKTTYLIKHRIHNRMKTIITTNYSEGDLLKMGFEERFLDRIKNYFEFVMLKGKSYRGRK